MHKILLQRWKGELQGLHTATLSLLPFFFLSCPLSSSLNMLVALRGAMQSRSKSQAGSAVQKRRASIYNKPPKTKIGPGQSFFIMSVFAVALLLPAGWILHHLPEYRQRPRPPPS